MRTNSLAVLTGIVMLVSFAALADGIKTTNTSQAVAVNTASQPVICHFLVHEGMLLRRGECHIQKEWDRIRRDEERSISDFQQRSLQSPPR